MYPYKFMPVCCIVLCCEVMYFKHFGHEHTVNTNRKNINLNSKAMLIKDIEVLLSIK